MGMAASALPNIDRILTFRTQLARMIGLEFNQEKVAILVFLPSLLESRQT
jgi:hypothetical protein